jgi:integrase
MVLFLVGVKEFLPNVSNALLFIVLALCQGLRVNEIDKLLWEQVNLSDKKMYIYQTENFDPKSKHSCSIIPISDRCHEYLKLVKEQLNGEKDDGFVVNPDAVIQGKPRRGVYRCNGALKTAKKWLRGKGVSEQKPLHTLRKECGSIVLRQTGDINATRLFLRDKTMAVIINHYADATVVKAPKFATQAS